VTDGTLAPGEVIKDVEIAQLLGVSRTPVREAIQTLEQLGMVETIPGRQTRVTAASPHDAALIYPPLGALHAVAAELAAGRMTDRDVEQMVDANEQLLQAALQHDFSTAREADTKFHGVVVARTKNPHLHSAIQNLLIHSQRLDTLYFMHLAPTQRSYTEHKVIIHHLREGDAQLAAQRTKENFEESIALFRDLAQGTSLEDS
jgi:DNA-binding GntR family transcriptional regulator